MQHKDWFLYDFFRRIQPVLEFELVPDQYVDFVKAFRYLFQQSWIELFQTLQGASPKNIQKNPSEGDILHLPIIQDILQLCESLWLMHPSAQKKTLFQRIFIEEIEKELKLSNLINNTPNDRFKQSESEPTIEESKFIEDEPEINQKRNRKPKKNENKKPTPFYSTAINISDVYNEASESPITHSDTKHIFAFPELKLPVDSREIQHSRQYYREGLNWVKTAEMDILATVNRQAKNWVVVDPIYQKKKKSNANILLLVDQLGSMKLFERFPEVIMRNFQKTISEGDTIEVVYFHNYAEKVVFKHPNLIDPLEISDLLGPQQTKKFGLFFIVSDAGGLNREPNFSRVNYMYALHELFLKHNSKCSILWFNPLPSFRLGENLSVKLLAGIFRMVTADRQAWKKIPDLIKNPTEQVPSFFSKQVDYLENSLNIPKDFSHKLDNNLWLKMQVEAFIESLASKNKSAKWFWIAAHSAYFPALTPDLIYQLCLNFKGIAVGYKHAHEQLVVVADILQSTLCREVASGVFEINPAIRNLFLDELINHKDFGKERIRELASFLKDYFEKKLKFSTSVPLSLKEAMELTILKETEPDNFVKKVTQLLDQIRVGAADRNTYDKLMPVIDLDKFNYSSSNIKNYQSSLIKFIDFSQSGRITEAENNLYPILDSLSISDADLGIKVTINKEYYDLINLNHLILKLDYLGVINELNNIISTNSIIETPHTLIFLELLYLYAHTQNDKVFGGLRSMVDHFPIKVNLEELNKTEIENVIKSINIQYFEKIRARYFPKMISVPQNNKDPKGVRPKQFSIAETPITWWQFNVFALATNQELILPKDWILEGNHPAVKIDWKDTELYVKWLNKNEQPPYLYDLPTEAEWMLSARSGGEEHFRFAGSDNLDEVGWHFGNSMEGYSQKQTHPVKLKRPNNLGLYDMSGNVWEWCEDIAYGNRKRVVKGGAWTSLRDECSIEHKNNQDVYSLHYALGFRVIRKLG